MSPLTPLQKRISKQESQTLDFASITWHGAQMELLSSHLQENLTKLLKTYPEADGATIRKMIARRQELEDEEIIVSNGPIAAFHLIARAFAGRKVLIPLPCLKPLNDVCTLYDCQVNYVSNMKMDEWPLEDAEICFVTTPNTPDGHILPHADLVRIFKQYPHVLFVLNQSYSTFSTTNKFKPGDIRHFPNVITIWSFSQPYGIPGLRIGYIAAPKPIAEKIWRVYTPMVITTAALEAAKYILIHPALFTLPVRKWLRATQELMSSLRQLDYLEVIPSDTTFFLIRAKEGKSKELYHYLRDTHHILLGDMDKFLGVDEGCLSITAREENDNQKLVAAIVAWHKTMEKA